MCVCDARFRQKEYLPILTYNRLLKNEPQRPSSRGSRLEPWQLAPRRLAAYRSLQQLRIRSQKFWQLALPFTARNAAQVCGEMPRCQVTPLRFELGPAASVLSIRSAVLSDVCLSEQLSKIFQNESKSTHKKTHTRSHCSVHKGILF